MPVWFVPVCVDLEPLVIAAQIAAADARPGRRGSG